MYPAHAVVVARPAYRQRGLVETAWIARLEALRRDVLEAETHLFCDVTQIVVDHLDAEDVMPGRDRGVRREDRRRCHRLERARQVEAGGDEFAAAFEHRERGVAFVDVPDG